VSCIIIKRTAMKFIAEILKLQLQERHVITKFVSIWKITDL